MKYIITLIISFFLIGCSAKTEYMKTFIPEPEKAPIFNKYNIKLAKINDTDYFLIDQKNMNILILNWLDYKRFAETNYEILLKLRENYINSNK